MAKKRLNKTIFPTSAKRYRHKTNIKLITEPAFLSNTCYSYWRVFKNKSVMKKITPIDWLIENHFGGINNCTPDFRNKIKKAKEMHEEQIIDAFHDGWMNDEHAKDYYNETFNK